MQATTIEEVLEARNVPAALRPHVTDTLRSLALNDDDPLTMKAESQGDRVTVRRDAGDWWITINTEVWNWVRYLGLTVPNVYKIALRPAG